MDVELQILKHLKRDAQPTISLIDRYCSAYPSSVTLRNQIVAETEFTHQEQKNKIDSLQQSVDENQVIKNGWERLLAKEQSPRTELLVE